ncbi:MAG: DUF4347 domain-containing protein [Nostoc sp. DedSLP03]|nr:DUF4347 domain-containing protein [Nostoc sp. DedSLP03]
MPVVAFIDAQLENYSVLANGVEPEVKVFALHPEEDGIKQITQVLCEYNHVESIHIVAHGAPGKIYLGNTELNLDTISNYAGELQTWFNNVSEVTKPKLVLYGCNIAAGDAGTEFLEKLHQLTQATIYASKNLVGSPAKGGSWDLDVNKGEGQNSCPLVFKSQILNTYSSVFTTGTDGFYTFYDSKEGDRGTVEFIDISTSSANPGTNIRAGKNFENDWLEKDILLGFNFKFYDKTFEKLSVYDNGYVTFISTNQINSQNGNLPNNQQTYSIFPYWDDFQATEVFYKRENGRFIVQWNNVKHFDSDENATFEIIFYENSNNIDFIYKDVLLGDDSLNYGNSATIGINRDNNVALKYLYNGEVNNAISRTLQGVTSIRYVTEPKLVNNKIILKEWDSTLSEAERTIKLTSDNFLATDVDNSNTPAKVKFKISNLQHGKFQLDGNIVAEFTQEDINNGKVTFIHDAGEDAPSFTVVVTDDYNETAPKDINTNSGITFTNINDTPKLSGLTSEITFLENALNQAADTIYKNSIISVTDDDSSQFNGGNLKVAYNGTSEGTDQLAIGSTNTISVSDSTVKYNGIEIGIIDGINNGSNGKDLVVNFINTNATLAAVQALIESLTYQTTSHTPKPSRTITVTVNDNGSPKDLTPKTSIGVTTEIKVTSENDAPVNNIPQPITINEDTTFTFSNNLISLSDYDAGNNPVQLKLTATNGTIAFGGATTGLNFSDLDGTDGTLEFTSSIANINSALNQLTFTPTLNSNNINKNTISLKVNTQDLANTGILGGNQTDEDTISFNVIPVNDAPVNQLTKTAVNVNEDTNLVFNTANGNVIKVSDVDAAESADEVEVTLAVTKGLLSLTNTTNIIFTQGNATGNAAITFKGKLANVNNALEGLIYQGNPNYNGADTLTITTSDLGHTGKSSALTDTDRVAITVNPVNDVPVNKVPDDQIYDTNRDLIFSRVNNNAISISDIDLEKGEGTREAEVTVSVTNGKLTLKNTTGIKFSQGTTNGNSTITFRGLFADINQALEGLIYKGNQEYKGKDVLRVVTSDLGNWGEGSILKDEDNINIIVSDLDTDGINNTTEAEIAETIAKNGSDDAHFQELSQRAADEGGIVAFYGGDGGTTKPIILAIKNEDQERITGDYPNFALVVNNLTTNVFTTTIPDPIAVFDAKDLRKSALKEIKSPLDVINFQVQTNPVIKDESRQQQIQTDINKKIVRVEFKLPDSVGEIPVNAIVQKRTDGTLYDLRRSLNSQWNNTDYELLTGAVLQDRNLDGRPDWAVVYLQDGQWGDEDGVVDGDITQSLAAVNLDLGASRMEVRSSQDGLNFYGNRSYVQFTLNRYSGKDASEVGVARVRFGQNGEITQVNGKNVSSVEEARQAILLRGETLFNSLTNKQNPKFGSQNSILTFEEGEQAVFFLIKGGTRDELRSNDLNSRSVEFSVSSLNGGTSIFQSSGNTSGQTATVSLARLFEINAKILSAEEAKTQLPLLAISQRQTQLNTSDELIDLQSSGAFDGKQAMLNFLVQREASFDNSAYFYRVDDAKGSIRDPLTGILIDPSAVTTVEEKQRYLQLATSDRLVQGAEFTTSNFSAKTVSMTVAGGEFYVPLLVSNGTLSSIGNDFSRVFTSYVGINSDRADHIRSLGNGMFGFEDLVGKESDRDYNDMILSIQQVQITA